MYFLYISCRPLCNFMLETGTSTVDVGCCLRETASPSPFAEDSVTIRWNHLRRSFVPAVIWRASGTKRCLPLSVVVETDMLLLNIVLNVYPKCEVPSRVFHLSGANLSITRPWKENGLAVTSLCVCFFVIRVSLTLETGSRERTFLSISRDFRERVAFCTCVLVRAAGRRKWVWSMSGVILNGENRSARINTYHSATLSSTNFTCIDLGSNPGH